MKLIRTTALAAALMTAAVPSLTTPANAWGWGWRGGWGWGGVGLGLATAAVVGSALAASSYYGYGYPMVMGPATAPQFTGATDTPITPIVCRHVYAVAHGVRRNWQ